MTKQGKSSKFSPHAQKVSLSHQVQDEDVVSGVYLTPFKLLMLIPFAKYSRSKGFFAKFLYVCGRAGRLLINFFFGRIADAICFFFESNRPYRVLNTVPMTIHE